MQNDLSYTPVNSDLPEKERASKIRSSCAVNILHPNYGGESPGIRGRGFSGGNLERQQFRKMMEDTQKTQYRRLCQTDEDPDSRRIDFISIREQFDISSPTGRAMMYIASVFSQLERAAIAEWIRDKRLRLNMTQRAHVETPGVPPCNLRRLEQNRARAI